MMPSAFVFMKGNDEWAAKRKASAHAFARDRLSKMMEVLKDQLQATIDKWMSEIEASPDKKTMIDIAVVFEDILASNIVTINFGEDISETPVEMDMRGATPGELVRKTVPLKVAIKEFTD